MIVTIKNTMAQLIMSRVRRNKNALICFIGDTGGGKSFASITLAETLMSMQGKKFSVAKKVCFNSVKFLHLINDDKTKGDVLIYDEVGVGMSSRRSMETLNVVLSAVIQSFRFKNLIIIFTVPSYDLIDKTLRSNVHYIFRTAGIDYQKKKSKFFVYYNQKNPLQGKLYHKRPFAQHNQRVRFVEFDMPSKENVKDYEASRKEDFERYYKAESTRIENRQRMLADGLTPLENTVKAYKEKGLNVDDIAKKMNKSRGTICSTLGRVSTKLGKVI